MAARPQTKSDTPCALVVNTRSRQGRRLYDDAKVLLQRVGVSLEAAYPIRDPTRLPQAVQEQVARGTKLIVVGGGDGTISSVVDAMAYRDVVLGILPLGTANSFARTLGIPVSVEAAVETIAHGKVAVVDLAKVDTDYFANNAALGVSAAIARSRLMRLKRYLGRASYPIVGAIKLMSHRPFLCMLTSPDRTVKVENALDVLIANGRYQGGALVAPEASVESRDLVIKVIKGPGKHNLARTWARRLMRRAPDPALVEIVRTTDVSIHADPPQYVSIDGEVMTRTPVRVQVAADALKLMVPKDFPNATAS